MQAYVRHVLADVHTVVHDILAAPHITDNIDAVINDAHDHLHDPHSRTCYIDASIIKVLVRASSPDLAEDEVRECIATLDRAIVIGGAAVDETRRDYVVHDVIRQLQANLDWNPPTRAVFITPSDPVPLPLSTATNSIRTLAALPSIVSARKRWSQAPFVMHGYANDWPATHQWASLPYLYSVAGPARIVPVEVGDDYRSDDWSQKLISWEEFLSSLDSSPSAASSHHEHRTLYLAQHNLLTQFPQLRQDVIIPDIVYASLDSPDFPAYVPPADVIVNVWLGPRGTISPAHTDPFFNCYVQVVGRKTVWLAPPSVAVAMYPYSSGADKNHNPAANTTSPLMSNTSRVDVFPERPQMEPSRTAFPLFWDVVPDKASCVTLGPGDLLFFPPGWWHAMRSEDVSFSVSMWF